MSSIDSKLSLYDIVNMYPDAKNIMAELGFVDITKPGMLQSVGKFMTIEKGAKAKKINWNYIIKTFKDNGYELI